MTKGEVKRNQGWSLMQGMVAHTFNPSAWEAQGGGSLSLRPACSTEQVPGCSGLHRETLSWKNKTTTKTKGSCTSCQPVTSTVVHTYMHVHLQGHLHTDTQTHTPTQSWGYEGENDIIPLTGSCNFHHLLRGSPAWCSHPGVSHTCLGQPFN